jgi:oligopeptidase B
MPKRSLLLLALLVAGCSGGAAMSPPIPTNSPASAPEAKEAMTTAPRATQSDPSTPAPPVARKERRVEKLHGQELVDDYSWLRKKDTPEVLDYLRAENGYTEAMTKHLAPLRDRIYDEMLGRVQETDVDVPHKDGAFLYYSRTEKGKQYPILCRKLAKDGDKAKEEVLLDLNEIGKKEKFVSLGPVAISDDGNLMAYGLDNTGFRQFTLHVRDLKSGKDLADRAERITSLSFAKDDRTLLYTTEDAVTKRSNKLFRHTLGSDAATAVLVYEEKDDRFRLHVGRSRSRALIFVQSESHTTSEISFVRTDKPDAPLTMIAPREQGHQYYVDHRGDELIIRTNSASKPGGPKSTNFRLVVAKLASPGMKDWREVIAHREGVMLADVDVFAGFTALTELEDAVPQIRIMGGKSLALVDSHRIALPEPIFTVRPDRNPEFEQTAYRFRYESPITPSTVYDYDAKKRALVMKKRVEVPGGYDPTRYEVRRAHATGVDGTKIPISLVYRKGTSPNGKNPLHLYGYGSYGIPIFPSFSTGVFSLLDRGVVYAIAHIRGGGELGETWHEAGRMMNKLNTFTDFIASAEVLVKEGWAAKDRIAIQGGSAGGLLMGAVTNMRPDLFRAVVAQVPFVDVMNTMLDESLPLTVEEFEEWGNPKKKDEFAYMLRYSPYDNVAAKAYPSMLVMTSYNDSQVMYWEPAKYVAKLRAMKTDKNPLLLRTLLDPAGHGGPSGRYERMKDQAFMYAWVLDRFGVTDTQ